MAESTLYNPKNKLRFVTATALFDGHDVSINIIRRLLQQAGAEVIHLGHNRSVAEIIRAAIQEDVQAIALSSYQGGHMEFFKYLREELNSAGRPDMRIFGGGGGVILPREARELQESGITRIYSPEDGRKMGLLGMISDMLVRSDYALNEWPDEYGTGEIAATETRRLARALTLLESRKAKLPDKIAAQVRKGIRISALEKEGDKHRAKPPLVLGITGPGGAGKSSLTDELLRRFLFEFPESKFCIFSVDPSKKKTGGALLGDRIRMNAIDHDNVFMHSFSTRGVKSEISEGIHEALGLARRSGFDLIIVESSGIGQADTDILSISDLTLYVMTSEYGAPMQLEKIDMLDFADLIAVNKFDRRGSEDAFRDVVKQIRRTRFNGEYLPEEAYPVYGTVAARFNDDGMNALFAKMIDIIDTRSRIAEKQDEKTKDTVCGVLKSKLLPSTALKNAPLEHKSSGIDPIIPQNRTNYLGEIAETVRNYHLETDKLCEAAKHVDALETAVNMRLSGEAVEELKSLKAEEWARIPPRLQNTLEGWTKLRDSYESDCFQYTVRGKVFSVPTFTTSLAGSKIPKICLPKTGHSDDIIRFLRSENLPGSFPFTAGVFPFKRVDEDPKRQFAGEGGPARTNRRFHYLTKNDKAKRLSTAFDSVTLYGCDPEERPDIFGKVGESGVSIASVDDIKVLFDGFDLCDPNTSVSMTINGPAPVMLAMFLTAAIDQQLEQAVKQKGRELSEDEKREISDTTLAIVRGTVQADILKEDQAQNTCIFSTDFALKIMGDIQEFFIKKGVRNYYSVSISGYHIAEAGANPITQLAFTLANGFSFVEYFLSRGMKIDDFAPNLSFFFSNGMDPEYTVIGRVARRIWAIAMRDKYHGNDRSQKLKYHCQTSGRSLHAQEIQFNDIRTTLQALLAISDNANSLHTNAYDEAITTPTEESVRRSMAIQMILNREYGLLKNENPWQGSYFIEYLTDMVEEAVLCEFERISSRGGVLGAMETQYQREKIQEESMHYEMLKHSGQYPIIGVNTYLNPQGDSLEATNEMQLARATYDEKNEQLARVMQFKERNSGKASQALAKLQQTALNGENIFAELLNTVRYATIGQITKALYSVGGQYRRSM